METSTGSRKTSSPLLLLKVSSFPRHSRLAFIAFLQTDLSSLSSSSHRSLLDNHYVRSLTNPRATSAFPAKKHTQAYDNVLNYFAENKVKLVVRLNNPLYDQRDFQVRGIEFKDMFFEDGTNVSDLSLLS